MSDSIRDVLIRVSIENGQTKLAAPDTSEWTSAIDRIKSQMAEMSINSTIRVSPVEPPQSPQRLASPSPVVQQSQQVQPPTNSPAKPSPVVEAAQQIAPSVQSSANQPARPSTPSSNSGIQDVSKLTDEVRNLEKALEATIKKKEQLFAERKKINDDSDDNQKNNTDMVGRNMVSKMYGQMNAEKVKEIQSANESERVIREKLEAARKAAANQSPSSNSGIQDVIPSQPDGQTSPATIQQEMQAKTKIGQPGYGNDVRDRAATAAGHTMGAMEEGGLLEGYSEEALSKLEARLAKKAEVLIREQDREQENSRKSAERSAKSAESEEKKKTDAVNKEKEKARKEADKQQKDHDREEQKNMDTFVARAVQRTKREKEQHLEEQRNVKSSATQKEKHLSDSSGGYASAASGAVGLARGMALLAASGDSSAQSIVKNVVAIQGLVGIGQSAIQVMQGLAAAQKATAAAQAIGGAAGGAAAGSGAVGGVVTSLAASLSAIAAPAAITAVALTGIVGVLIGWRVAANEARASTERLLESVTAKAGIQGNMIAGIGAAQHRGAMQQIGIKSMTQGIQGAGAAHLIGSSMRQQSEMQTRAVEGNLFTSDASRQFARSSHEARSKFTETQLGLGVGIDTAKTKQAGLRKVQEREVQVRDDIEANRKTQIAARMAEQKNLEKNPGELAGIPAFRKLGVGIKSMYRFATGGVATTAAEADEAGHGRLNMTQEQRKKHQSLNQDLTRIDQEATGKKRESQNRSNDAQKEELQIEGEIMQMLIRKNQSVREYQQETQKNLQTQKQIEHNFNQASGSLNPGEVNWQKTLQYKAKRIEKKMAENKKAGRDEMHGVEQLTAEEKGSALKGSKAEEVFKKVIDADAKKNGLEQATSDVNAKKLAQEDHNRSMNLDAGEGKIAESGGKAGEIGSKLAESAKEAMNLDVIYEALKGAFDKLAQDKMNYALQIQQWTPQ